MVNSQNLRLSFLSLVRIVTAHGGGMGIFGGAPEVLNALLPRFPPHHHPRKEVNERFEMSNVFTGSFLNERATAAQKLTCGVVNGTCPAGYCCSIGGFW